MLLAAAFLTMHGWMALLPIVAIGAVLAHRGSYDEAAVSDIVQAGDASINQVALTANSTIPAGLLTGSADVYLSNTANTPGTQTTRTAAQIYQDFVGQLGIQNLVGTNIAIRIVHQGSGTLTLAAGSGVTFGTGTYTVLTGNFRDFVLTFNSPTTCTLQTTGVGTWS